VEYYLAREPCNYRSDNVIAIIDYGMGNLKSVQNALEKLGIDSIITNAVEEINCSSGIIIPGVGAFPDAMNSLKKKNLEVIIKRSAEEKKPILGICLGMQLLFEKGEENIECEGIGILKGCIKKLKGNVKIPHMGWNDLSFEKACPLLQGVEQGSYVYFVHSYYAELYEEEILNAYTNYEVKIPAIVSKNNIFGIQFHPEKSGDIGMKILKNFGELVK
jgi:glutamine amidotransferase